MNYRASLFMLLLLFEPAGAVNLETHALITLDARDRSALGIGFTELGQRYGFDRLEPRRVFDNQNSNNCAPLNPIYYRDAYIDANADWTGNPLFNARARCVTQFDQLSMPPDYTGLLINPSELVGFSGWLRLEGWLMRGAIREDDYKSGRYDNPNLVPDTDPWVDEFRSVHHFYNPIDNSTGLGVLAGFFANATRSTTWALGIADTDNWENVQLPDAARGNHFSYADARKLMFLALTYKTGGTLAKEEEDSQLRMNMWATMFKSLGHIVHLLQDTASPQHVRGEGHSYLCNGAWYEDLTEAAVPTRTFENYTNFRVTDPFDKTLGLAGVLNAEGKPVRYPVANLCDDAVWRNMFTEAGQTTPTDTVPWTGGGNTYPIPQFSVQRKFFTTRTEDSAINARRGLADYVNRGFFTEGAFLRLGGIPGVAFPSPPPLTDPAYTPGIQFAENVPGLGNVQSQTLYWRVPDAVAPNYPNPELVDGKAPIVSRTLWADSLVAGAIAPAPLLTNLGGTLTLRNYAQIADMTMPRAVAYTAGFFNFFFRGKLEIEPNAQRLFGVVDMGRPHSMTTGGYPVIDGQTGIFGFEKIRLKVRNLTDVIVESGTNANVPQVVGVGKLVAVARYHRNACYKPDLSGERVISFSPPPTLQIAEPICTANLPTRTNYQEISVSAAIPITSEADLPGGRGGAVPASVEKTFDFSADPIPVNATDLFIQVVYRGQLGEETDGIAVGTLDVQEPTFLAAWNNTDFYFSELGNQWLSQNPLSFPARGAVGLAICAGNPSALVYRYIPENGPGFPFFQGNLTPGVARLAFLFAKPASVGSRYNFRVLPLMATPPNAQQRLANSPGQQRQASKELYTTADPLPAPSYCQIAQPAAGSNFWCFDPVQRRRGQIFGDIARPFYYTSGANGNDGPDVDAPPAQPIFPGLRVREGGVNRFNQDVTLTACPNPTTLTASQIRSIEIREEAWSLGIDPDNIGP
jgi:hypothetical protein